MEDLSPHPSPCRSPRPPPPLPKTLEKTFYMEDPDEVVPRKFVGSAIAWEQGKDTTVTLVKKRVQVCVCGCGVQGGGRSAQAGGRRGRAARLLLTGPRWAMAG
jgi:hypothetical protein